MRSYLFFLALGVMVVSCGPIPQETNTLEADREAVEVLLEQVVQAFNAGDLDAYMACFTDDAVWMLPNQPVVTGKEVARTWYQGVFDRTAFSVTPSTEELRIAGDWAYARRTYRGEAVRKATGELLGRGSKRISILHRQTNGNWRIARDMWNSDALPAEPET